MGSAEFFWLVPPVAGQRHACQGSRGGLPVSFNPLLLGPALFLTVCWALFVLTAISTPAAGQADGRERKAPSVAFDIAPQPLEGALDAFSSASNVQVLYETSLTSGRSSARVRGLFKPEAALRALLAGTGLSAWYTTGDSYTLVPQREAVPSGIGDAGSPPPEIGRYSHFLGIVQADLVDGLCRSPRTRPGQYRIALKFRIGPSGEVVQTTLLNSTGDHERDAEIIATVDRVTIDEAPPSKMPQPITMVIAPRLPNVTGDCASVDGMGSNR